METANRESPTTQGEITTMRMALVSLPDGVWNVIDNDLKGQIGDGDSEVIRNLVIAKPFISFNVLINPFVSPKIMFNFIDIIIFNSFQLLHQTTNSLSFLIEQNQKTIYLLIRKD